MYAERPSSISGATAWVSSGGGETRVLPDGCLDLLWFDGALVVAGPDTRAYRSAAPVDGVVGLRFGPGLTPAWLGVPAAELVDQRVRLDDLWPGAEVRRLTDRVASAGNQAHVLEAITGPRLAARPPDPVARHVAGLLAAGWSVSGAAAAVGLGERQLHRRSTVAFGYGPKTLARILRLDRALTLARAGVPAIECADRAGFADQAHLARDVRSLTGVTLTELTGSQPSGANRSTELPSGSKTVA